MPKVSESQQFADRLRSALESAGVRASPTLVANAFNLRYHGRSITPHTASATSLAETEKPSSPVTCTCNDLDWRSSSGALQLTEPTQLWRWFTPMLLHFSLTHLVFNLAWWLYLGRQFEQRLGLVMLLNVTLSVALVSNAAQYFMVNPNFGGLSGVVYALVGYCYLSDQLSGRQRYLLSHGLFGFMLVWLVLGFMDLLWVNMANWAHLGGLGCGLLWAFLSRDRRRP